MSTCGLSKYDDLALRSRQIWSRLKNQTTRDPAHNSRDNRYRRAISLPYLPQELYEDFDRFLEAFGRPPEVSGYTLYRIEPDKGYVPGNCKWQPTPKRTRSTKKSGYELTIDGRTQTITGWAKEVGISRDTIVSRMKSGLTGRQLITTMNLASSMGDQVKKVSYGSR